MTVINNLATRIMAAGPVQAVNPTDLQPKGDTDVRL